MINVVMLHSVGNNETQWCENWLSVDVKQFEYLCGFLLKNGYKTDFLDKWYYLEDHPNEKTQKDLFLTFDDGYLDNLLIAYPLMKHYGIKGTIFVNPEFVDPSFGIRTIEERQGNTLGFLNWDEIYFLDKSGVFDIQSHSMSHDYFFSSNKLIGIYEGQNEYHFMSWNAQHDKKMYWQYENQTSFVKWGTPVFEYGRALGIKRYFPDSQFNERAIDLYEQKLPKNEMMRRINDLLIQYPGRYETEKEMEERFRYELFDSKKIIEERLHKKIDYLCWPGGGYNELSLKIAEEAGYKASTIASKERTVFFDNYKKIYKRIKRAGMSSVVQTQSNMFFEKNKRYLVWVYYSTFRRSYFFRIIMRLRRLLYSI